MTVRFNTMPKSTARAASPSDGQLRSTLTPGAGLGLPAISPAQVSSLNAFYRRRPALAFPVAGRAARIKASWPLAAQDASPRCRLDLTVDGAPGAVILSPALIEAAIAALDPNQGLDRLDPPQVALLLELALSDELSMLETSLGARLAVTSVRAQDDDRQNKAAALAVEITVEGLGSFGAELLLQPAHAIMFAQFLDRCASRPDPAGRAGEGKSIYPPPLAQEDRPGEIDLPVAVCVRVAAATFAVGEIATLSPGDVVIADHGRQQLGTAVAVIAELLVAPVELTAAGAQVAARPTRAHGSLWEWSMENGGDRAPAGLRQDTDVDNIPVKLLFELGRIELSLAEVRQLAPGALIPMLRPLEDSVDIVANGRRIGRGNLVQIGDSMGIRITRLFDNV
jgi:type III secretion protein Q